MGDFAGEALWRVTRQPGTSQGPEFGKDVVLNEGYVLYLTIESGDEAELRFGASICLERRQSVHSGARVRPLQTYLALVKHFLRDFIF